MATTQPGNGGVDRGRADAAMIWGKESAGQSDRFAVRVLKPGDYLDPDQSTTLGVSQAAPEANPQRAPTDRTSVPADQGQGAWRRRLSPRHRDAVKAFFTPAGR
ncbi:MAG: hypothetical protein U1E76_07610 [Planctomycetota bacterium]